MDNTLSDRLRVSLPADDPRFVEIRAVLAGIRQRGQTSPIPRMLGEWSLLGFLLTTGKIVIGHTKSDMVNAVRETLDQECTDAETLAEERRYVERALPGIDFD